MLDCENRVSAARYFLDRARDDTLTDELHIWYTQATVIFAIAAIENLMYDYGEHKTGKSMKEKRLELDDFKRMFASQTDFYRRLESDLSQNPLYQFLRAERNLIVHRGEPDKKRSGKGRWTNSHYFEGWKQQSIDEACQEICEWLTNLIDNAKRSYPELV